MELVFKSNAYRFREALKNVTNVTLRGTMRFSGTFRNIPDKTLGQGSEAFRLILSFPESGEAPKEKMLHKTAREKSDWRRSDLTLLFCYISHFVVT